MSYVSVVCTNPDCGLETTRKEDTEYCPKCSHYTQPINGLTSTAQPVAPMVNNSISPDVLRKLSETKPIELDGHDMKFIYSLLEEKQMELVGGLVQLESENVNAEDTKEHFDLCRNADHAMKIMNLIKADFKRKRAQVEINRRMTGFYSKSENSAIHSMPANQIAGIA